MAYPTFKARYFNGLTSKPYTVTVKLKDDLLELHDTESEKQLKLWYKNDLKVLDYQENQSCLVLSTFDNPDIRLTLTDPQAKDLFKRWLPKEAYPKYYASTNLAALSMYALITMIICAAIYQTFPILTNTLAHQIPYSWEKRIGDNYFNDLKETMAVCKIEDTPAEQILHKLTKRLTDAHDNEHPYEIHLISSEQVNAFALPGNTILLMDGLIQKATHPDQITAVIAHEMGHVVHRHVVHTVVKGQFLQIAFNLITGGDGTTIGASSDVLSSIANLHNNRTHEYEADKFAVETLHAASINPSYASELMNILQHEEEKFEFLDKIPEFLLTHPDTDKRIKEIDNLATELKKEQKIYKDSLSETEWKNFKKACSDTKPKDNLQSLIQEIDKKIKTKTREQTTNKE